MSQAKKNWFVVWIAGLVSLGGILYGYDMGVISGALLFIRSDIQLSDAQVGLIVGAVLGGGLFGTLVAGPIGDRYGRRFIIALSSLTFILGVLFILMAHSFAVLFIARLLLGVGVGIVAVSVPLYVAEIVPSKNRGKFVTLFQLLLTFGIALAYFIDLLFISSGNWRAMFGVLLIPSVTLLLGIFLLPESPRWLVANNQIDAARKVLEKVHHNASEVIENLFTIRQGLNQTNGSWSDLFSPRFLLPTSVAVGIAIFNQLTGINAFLQYAPIILKNAGIASNQITMIGSAGIGVLNFLFTIVSISLIDSLGRRPLLLVGIAGVVAAETFLGIVNCCIPDSAYAGIFSLIGLLFFIIFFAVGPGVVVWLVISELFPTQIRGKGITICLFFNSLASTALATLFLPLVKYLGMGQVYLVFAFFTLGYFILAYYFLPETKEKSLEEIQHFFQKKGEAEFSSETAY